MNRILEATWQAQGLDGKNVVNGYLNVFKEPLDERAVLIDVYTGETLQNPLRTDGLGQVRDFFVDGDSHQTYWIRLEDENGNELYTKHYITTLNGISGTGTLKNYTAGDFIEMVRTDERTEKVNVKPTKILQVESPLSFIETSDSLTLRLLGQFATTQELANEAAQRTYSDALINARIDAIPVVQQFWNQIGDTLSPKTATNVKSSMFSTDEYGNAANWYWAYQFATQNNKSCYITYDGTEYRYDPTREVHIYIDKPTVNNGETEIKSNGSVIGVVYANQADDNEIDIGETLPSHDSSDVGKILRINSDNETYWDTPTTGVTGTIQAFNQGSYESKSLSVINLFDAITGEQQLTFKDADNNAKTYLMLKEQSGSGFVYSNGVGLSVKKPTGDGIYGVTSAGAFSAVPSYSEGYGIIIRDSGQILTKARMPEYGSNNVPAYSYQQDWTVIGDGPGNNRILFKWQSENLCYIGLRYLGSGSSPRFTFIGKKTSYVPGSDCVVEDVSSVNQLYSYSGGIFCNLSGIDVEDNAKVNIDGIFCDNTYLHIVKYKDGDGNLRVSFTAYPAYQNT